MIPATVILLAALSNALDYHVTEKIYDKGWARWSKWSPCSVTCSGGVQYQLRRCLDIRCMGPSKRYRTCKTESCLEGDDIDRECKKRGALHFAASSPHFNKWASSLALDSCQAVCKSLIRNELFFLDRTLRNGAKCLRSDGVPGACLRSKCEVVGCDRIIGSKLGNCSCGQKQCDQKLFQWKETDQYSACDRSCGKNRYQVSISVCVNSANQRMVPERMCADLERPRPSLKPCPDLKCDTAWKLGPWSHCTVSCGKGKQTRSVECIDGNKTIKTKVDKHYCWNVKKPPNERRCIQVECPRWNTSLWSDCNCREKIQQRNVECIQNQQRITGDACPSPRPPLVQSCDCNIPNYGQSKQLESTLNLSGVLTSSFGESSSSVFQWNSNDVVASPLTSNGFSFNDKSTHSKPQYNTGPWGACSTSCGSGVRTRSVECVAHQGITGNLARLPDFECEGLTKPSIFQPCESKPCDNKDKQSNQSGKGPFRWDYGDWGPCSASCLGGKQKSTLRCLDIGRNLDVPWFNCNSKQKPVDLIRPCNTEQCPPTWDSVEFSACSHSCGGGIRSRKVRCVRRVSPEGSPESILILPDAQCPLPKPRDQEACGLVDCPFNWKVEEWSPCSRSCGQGQQHRVVVCERRDASGNIHSFNPPLPCAGIQRPATLQLCNQRSCNEDYNTYQVNGYQAEEGKEDKNRVKERFGGSPADVSISKFDQTFPEHRRLTLNVGGYANLYEGTSIKVKCPVKNFDKQNIYWTKDGRKLENSAHMKVSGNGALRIFHASLEDAGVYACFANGVQGNVTLKFKPKDIADLPIDETTDLNNPSEVDKQLIQKVRDSLFKLGESKAYDALKNVHEPGRLAVDYEIGAWSSCTQYQCNDVEGSQVRLLRCRLKVYGITAYLGEDICDSFAVERPVASRSCRNEGCPKWEASDWSDCSVSRCSRDSISISRREVKCLYQNGTSANHNLCDRKTRPKIKKECQNTNCTAEWRTSVWGKCSKSCDDGGVQMRILRCAWKGTKKPAGHNCDPSQRPSAIRSCAVPDLPPCSKQADAPQSLTLNGQCLDHSRFCDILRVFHSCDEERIRLKCCLSCSLLSRQN